MSELAKALVRAQKAFGPALKQSVNPAFRSRYADLASCIDAVIGALNDNGVFFTQVTHPSKGSVIVETIFIHESGEERSMGKIEIPVLKQDPQGYGSATTYARRYSLQAACGIAPEDDDGNLASNQPEPVRTPVVSRTMAQQSQEQKPVAPPSAKQLPIVNHAQPIVDEALKIAKQGTDSKALENRWKERIEQAKREALEMAKGQNAKT